jgi:hypothetical protein
MPFLLHHDSPVMSPWVNLLVPRQKRKEWVRAAQLRVGLDSLGDSAVQLGQVGLGAGGAGGHKVDNAEGELVDDALESTESGGEEAGNREAGEEGVLADNDVQETLVDADKLHGFCVSAPIRPRLYTRARYWEPDLSTYLPECLADVGLRSLCVRLLGLLELGSSSRGGGNNILEVGDQLLHRRLVKLLPCSVSMKTPLLKRVEEGRAYKAIGEGLGRAGDALCNVGGGIGQIGDLLDGVDDSVGA